MVTPRLSADGVGRSGLRQASLPAAKRFGFRRLIARGPPCVYIRGELTHPVADFRKPTMHAGYARDGEADLVVLS
jgi:hypothetical protein